MDVLTRINTASFIRVVVALLMGVLLVSCASNVTLDTYNVSDDELLDAVIKIRERLATDPSDIELRSRLKQLELRAADYHYQRGKRAYDEAKVEESIAEYQKGLLAKPDYPKLAQAMLEVVSMKEADNLHQEGELLLQAGMPDEAKQQFQQALEIFPEHQASRQALAEMEADTEDKSESALLSKDLIDLNFKDTDIKEAFEFVSKSFGVNVIFDNDIQSESITLFAQNVTFSQALELMLSTTKTFYKRLGNNTIVIIPDTTDKKGQYEEHDIRVFYLRAAKAKEMVNLIKGLLSLKKVIVNEEMNSILVRDTPDVLQLVDNVVRANDRKPAEMVFDVEILEVNRTKSERLGFDFGSEIGVSYDPFRIDSIWADKLKEGIVTIPNMAFRYFKQDVDAKILANPKIRVMDNKAAKIHIGDRVPLRSSTILDATGQTRTTFEYRDIGIRLTVQPAIHLDNSVTVQLGLEVSSLGQNLGTQAEPAFSIGTRNAETYMLLRDGETAILGGLIRDEDRNSTVKIPGVSSIPAAGELFKSHDDQATRTDVLLTITPRVVRQWDLPPKKSRIMYSGTRDNYTSTPAFASLSQPGNNKSAPVIAVSKGETSSDAPPIAPGLQRRDTELDTETSTGRVSLKFQQPVYSVRSGQDFSANIVGEHLNGIKNLPVSVIFNPTLLELVNTESSFSGGEEAVELAQDKNSVSMQLVVLEQDERSEGTSLARLHFKALKSGVSYLVFRSNTYTSVDGGEYAPQVNASRIVIK